MLPAIRRRNTFPSLIDEFFGRDFFPGFFRDFDSHTTMPAVNIVEEKDDFMIEVAAPGLDKKDFKIDLDNNVLTISSEKENDHEEKNDRFMRREFSYTSFSRSFALPESVESEKIKATYKDGVLHLVIPKREEAKEKPARVIDIS
jgi:HSP20 family protein